MKLHDTPQTLIRFQPQPDFPVEDISEHNAAMAAYYLHTAVEKDTYRDTYLENLQLLHDVGNRALTIAGIEPGNNRGEYRAFCEGFTTIEYVATLLDARPYQQLHSGDGMQHFYINTGDMAGAQLWVRGDTWQETHPITVAMVRNIARQKGDTDKQLAARTVGAQISSDILYTR